jgi:hypothetical protein
VKNIFEILFEKKRVSPFFLLRRRRRMKCVVKKM